MTKTNGKHEVARKEEEIGVVDAVAPTNSTLPLMRKMVIRLMQSISLGKN